MLTITYYWNSVQNITWNLIITTFCIIMHVWRSSLTVSQLWMWLSCPDIFLFCEFCGCVWTWRILCQWCEWCAEVFAYFYCSLVYVVDEQNYSIASQHDICVFFFFFFWFSKRSLCTWAKAVILKFCLAVDSLCA